MVGRFRCPRESRWAQKGSCERLKSVEACASNGLILLSAILRAAKLDEPLTERFELVEVAKSNSKLPRFTVVADRNSCAEFQFKLLLEGARIGIRRRGRFDAASPTDPLFINFLRLSQTFNIADAKPLVDN